MRFDVDSELAAYVRKQRVTERALFDFATERMLLAALLADDAIGEDGFTTSALALVDDLELDDFAELRCRQAFTALRNLQAADKPHAVYDVFAELERTGVRGVEFAWLVVDLVATEPRVTADWIGCACARLRELANHRRLA